MWCIGRITAEYRERMYDVLALYAKPYDVQEPVICLDEKSKQLLEQTRQPLAASPGHIAREDYEYRRAGDKQHCENESHYEPQRRVPQNPNGIPALSPRVVRNELPWVCE